MLKKGIWLSQRFINLALQSTSMNMNMLTHKLNLQPITHFNGKILSYPIPLVSLSSFFFFSVHFSHNNSSINTLLKPYQLPLCPCSKLPHIRTPFFFSISQSRMSRRTSKRVSFSPDVNERPTVKHGDSVRTKGNRKRVIVGVFTFRLVESSSFSPARLLSRLGAKVAGALRFVSIRRDSSRKFSSSNLPRSRSLAESIDSHRAEAIEDCIEFLNSSSSLSRSNSVSTCSC